MNIYLISQEANNDYDTYDSAVVVAMNEEQARCIHPCGSHVPNWHRNGTWCALPDEVKVQFIGLADSTNSYPHVVCASFNAG